MPTLTLAMGSALHITRARPCWMHCTAHCDSMGNKIAGPNSWHAPWPTTRAGRPAPERIAHYMSARSTSRQCEPENPVGALIHYAPLPTGLVTNPVGADLSCPSPIYRPACRADKSAMGTINRPLQS